MLTLLLLFSQAASAGPLNDFVGPYELTNWSNNGIAGGAAGIDTDASSEDTAVFWYDVDLSDQGFGVSLRRTDWQVIADATGTTSMTINVTLNHAWWLAGVTFESQYEDGNGDITRTALHREWTDGEESFTVTVDDMPIVEGHPFGLRIGGGNADSASFINGTLIVTDFVATATDDCAGVPDGDSTTDQCGTCDGVPSNDCEQDCSGVWGGADSVDECGTCDNNPSNDCVRDCADVWGGTAVTDECGTCDTDTGNDCIQDCAGTWAGTATTDNCGHCDDDSTNDCVQDCGGDWGGTAVSDPCGTCDTDSANDCVEDCAGEWGGPALLDNCDVCDTDPLNDCEADCDGVSGGDAVEDMCGQCDADPQNDCIVDCHDEWGGTAALDTCGVCAGGSTGIEPDACGGSTRLFDPAADGGDGELASGCSCDGTPAGSTPWVWLTLTGAILVGQRRRRQQTIVNLDR